NNLPWDDSENRVDVLFRGDADDGVCRIAQLLGWKVNANPEFFSFLRSLWGSQ
ncbi:unnamed protein product, partial [Dicrocoelium dendriticum]